MPSPAAGLLLAAAYLIGSIPFGLLLGKALGFDIRKSGSGNIGATNLARAAGRKWGVAAFLLDYAKGLAPPLAAALWMGVEGVEGVEDGPAAAHGAGVPEGSLPVLAGALAVLGHVFPVFLGFRGGKGVATAFGAMTALSWPAALAAGILWLVLYASTRTVSVASMAAAVALPAGAALAGPSFASASYAAVLVFAVLLAALILVRHSANIARLLRGEELKFR
jgi:glycerol-3-phosphate acyltransferase PlsY